MVGFFYTPFAPRAGRWHTGDVEISNLVLVYKDFEGCPFGVGFRSLTRGCGPPHLVCSVI